MHWSNWKALFLACMVGLSTGLVLQPFSSVIISVQASESRRQSFQEGVIETCVGTYIDLASPQLAYAELKALADCKSMAISQLVEALKAQDWKVKAIAAHTLGLFGKESESSVSAISELLHDENADVRFSAAQALGAINSKESVSPLIRALKDRDENVRFATADALLQLGEKVQKADLLALYTFLEEEKNIGLSGMSRGILYSDFTMVDTFTQESKLAIPLYVAALGNSNWFLRERAAQALTEIRLDSTAILNTALSMGRQGGFYLDGHVRATLTYTLARANIDILITALSNENEDPFRRDSAIELLGMLGSRKAISPLIIALKRDPTNEYTIRALGRLGANEAVSVLVETWQKAKSRQSNDSFFRREIINSIERIDSNEAVSALIQTFSEDRMSFIALDIIKKITKKQINTEKSISLLQSILESGDTDAIFRIVNPLIANNNSAYSYTLRTALLQLGIEKVASILKPVLLQKAENEWDSQSMFNRYAAVKCLTFFKSEAVPIVLKTFSDVEAFYVFMEAMKVASSQKDTLVENLSEDVLRRVNPRVMPFIISSLQNIESIDLIPGTASTLFEILEILGSRKLVDSRELVPLLIKLLDNDRYKESAIHALVEIKAAEAFSALSQSLKDKDDYIRLNSAISLARIGSTTGIPQLIEGLNRGVPPILSSDIVAGLGEIGSAEILPILNASPINEFSNRSESEAEALDKIKSEIVIPALIEALKHNSWLVRLKAATALESIGTEAVPYLVRVLHSNSGYSSILQAVLRDRNADHRRSAAYVLWKMGNLTIEAKDSLVAIVEDENDNLYVRWMAATALENKGENVEQFFQQNSLINPKYLIPTECPNYVYVGRSEVISYAQLSDFSDYEGIKVDIDELVYAGRCIYGNNPGPGGSAYGFYEQLKALLARK